ncbi:TRAP transporter small permease [Caldalkalibacillus uzonensis]|nr:TRAP transporter small permease [Caldalkalibacillus uzonensis]
MDKLRVAMNKMLMITTSVLTVVLVLGALWQVFSRYVLNAPSTFTEELLRFVLIWVAMLGASYAFGTNQHLAIVFLRNKLKGRRQQVVRMINDLLVICFAAVILVKGGYDISISTMTQVSPILKIPMGYVYTILPISGVIIIIYQILNIKDWIGNIKKT